MVDVAFQMVLFFLVTATTVLYKSLEVPKPSPETPAAGAQQGRRWPGCSSAPTAARWALRSTAG